MVALSEASDRPTSPTRCTAARTPPSRTGGWRTRTIPATEAGVLWGYRASSAREALHTTPILASCSRRNESRLLPGWLG